MKRIPWWGYIIIMLCLVIVSVLQVDMLKQSKPTLIETIILFGIWQLLLLKT